MTDQKLPAELNRIKILQLLLYARGIKNEEGEPIVGRTRLQKEVFLVQQELHRRGVKSLYPFRPYKKGPLSYELYNDLDWLKYSGRVREDFSHLADGTPYSIFSLPKGRLPEIRKLLKEQPWPKVFEIIEEIKKATNGMNLTYLVESVHGSYPEYMIKEPVAKLLASLAKLHGLELLEQPMDSTKKKVLKSSMTDEIRRLRDGLDLEGVS